VSRPLVWLAVAPFGAGGVLVAHALAYRLTSTPGGAAHDYLEHAPQVLALLALAALALTAVAGKAVRPSVWPFPLAGVAAFVLQEHLERLVHGGHFPWLLTTPAFLVGLALQVPVALLAALLARRLLLASAGALRARRPHVRHRSFIVRAPACIPVCQSVFPPGPARGPPAL
jgi:cytochrome bd-type quinol oxidase subunit 2